MYSKNPRVAIPPALVLTQQTRRRHGDVDGRPYFWWSTKINDEKICLRRQHEGGVSSGGDGGEGGVHFKGCQRQEGVVGLVYQSYPWFSVKKLIRKDIQWKLWTRANTKSKHQGNTSKPALTKSGPFPFSRCVNSPLKPAAAPVGKQKKKKKKNPLAGEGDAAAYNSVGKMPENLGKFPQIKKRAPNRSAPLSRWSEHPNYEEPIFNAFF